jgi:sucrose-phosphate synthase
VDASYGQEEECLVKGRGELGGAYIVRLPCGPPQQYVRKELLWPYVREFADRGIAHATSMLAAMAEAGRRCELYAVHGELVGGGGQSGRLRHGSRYCILSVRTACSSPPLLLF